MGRARTQAADGTDRALSDRSEVGAMDFVALGIGIGFFLVCAALTRWCDRVLRGGPAR
jgi:hypothetical protein